MAQRIACCRCPVKTYRAASSLLLQPAQKRRQFAIGGGPEHDLPVRGHDAVAQEAEGVLYEGLVEHAQEGAVIGGFAKQLEPGRRAVERVLNRAARCLAGTAWHA